MSRWVLNLLFIVLVGSILAFAPLGYRTYEPVQKNNQAVEALNARKYDEAIALLSDAMANNPDNGVFRDNLLAAYNGKAVEAEKSSEGDKALGWYEKGLSLDPTNQILLQNYVTALNNMAVHQSNERNFPESQGMFERAGKRLAEVKDEGVRKEIQKNYSSLLALWGAELMKRDQYDQAKTAFNQALELNGQNPTAAIYLGDLFYEADAYEDARRLYALAMEHDKTNATYLKDRLAMIEDESKVQALFKKAEDSKKRFLIQYVDYNNGTPIEEILEMLNDAYDDVGKKLGIYPARHVNVKIYEGEDFYKISRLPEWAVGIFDGKMRLRVEDIQSGPAQVRDLLYHEYTHAVLAMNVKQKVPAWFHEGLAQLMEPQFAENAGEQTQMRAALARKQLSFEVLKESFRELGSRQDAENAYLLSKYFLASLNRTHGTKKMNTWIAEMTTTESKFEESFHRIYGEEVEDAQEKWIKSQVRN
ncbi:hypothetical protein CVU37_02130 [candidate division BRC1 bacterium HGW-BRC1-1]|jgi:tetratricopeptide (TPR) repeat protein|nr:MAG: hypothetical protein CVU37_02130 [candidate division BRC1 bacterium HGW-BRC1-1]